jgi:hypothetical protein
VQDTQQHRPDQPGHLAQDFQSHLRQQLNGNVTPTILSPTPTYPNQEQALQELQHHLEWYQQNFGHSPAPSSHSNNLVNVTSLDQPNSNEMSAHSTEAQMPQQQPIINMPQTPVSHAQAQTVPNTPQHYVQAWPSPPPTNGKHVRSQSYQYDVAPMPTSFDGSQVMTMASSPYVLAQDSFTQDPFTDSNDAGYASSIYSSSIVDPTSPGRQSNNIGGMPTLFEEPTPPLGAHQPDDFSEEALLQATAGASDDFNSPNFMVGGSMGGMSPRTAMLHNLGDEVNASIVETGIAPEVVDAYISQQDPVTKGWNCLYVDPDHNNKTCRKFFKRKENARSHVQNHLNDRQFQCNDCGKTFVRQHDMKRHAAIHSNDRPHICPCGSGFARHDALTRHRQRGMCKGALPGFEKAEEDKPKRGRPKKERPDMDDRTTKAKKARKMDRECAADGSYASSNSSAMSENGLPVTPPDSSDFMDAEAFMSLAQTPPTSPPSPQKSACISPAALIAGAGHNGDYGSFTGVSSPENGFNGQDDFNFGAVDANPGLAKMQLFSDAMSPEYGSTMPGSSPPSGDEMEMPIEKYGMDWGRMGVPLSPTGIEEAAMEDMISAWITAQ